MQLSQLVTSLETSQKLKALGVEQESLFYWVQICNDEWGKELVFDKYSPQYGKQPRDSFTNVQNPISSFLSEELGYMFPIKCEIKVYNKSQDRKIVQIQIAGEYYEEEASTEAEARGKLLIYLKENNLV